MEKPPFVSGKGISLGINKFGKPQDELDSLIAQTLEQQENSILLTERIAKRVAETEDIATDSAHRLNNQGGILLF
jgi:hypothetical protein